LEAPSHKCSISGRNKKVSRRQCIKRKKKSKQKKTKKKGKKKQKEPTPRHKKLGGITDYE